MMDAAMKPPSPKSKELKGRHVLVWMLAFFGVIFAVNGVFLYHAITSFPGEDVKKSYLQGLNYNQTLEDRARQAELGWRAEIGLQDGALILHLEDGAGTGLSGHPVVGELRRTATTEADRVLTFTPGLGGTYTAATGDLSPGQWEVRVTVMDLAAEKAQFVARKTLLVK